jgi:hypothetical protein
MILKDTKTRYQMECLKVAIGKLSDIKNTIFNSGEPLAAMRIGNIIQQLEIALDTSRDVKHSGSNLVTRDVYEF